MDAIFRRHQSWMLTQTQIYEALYARLREILQKGGWIATWHDGRIINLSDATHIRQTASACVIQIKVAGEWQDASPRTIEEWARTFEMTGPQEHFWLVHEAIEDERPVPKEVIVDHAALAGFDRRSRRLAKKPQLTRTVNERGILLGEFNDIPALGELVWRPISGPMRVVGTIEGVLSYRVFDKAWIVEVDGGEFVVQRVNGVDGRSWLEIGL